MTGIINNKVENDRSWEKIIMKYNRPDMRKSIWQILNSFVPYLMLWYLMIQSLQYSYWLTLLLALPAAGFLIRLFIIFHDCGHGSFFKSKKTNDIVGKIIGILTFTPYSHWHYTHKIHHATSGDLDKRGIGDVWTLTVDEYLALSKRKKLFYRLYRHPLLMFTFGSVYLVLFRNRITHKGMDRAGVKNVYLTNIGLLILATVMGFTIGLKAFLMIQLPVIIFAHTAGLWLFYVQHQFDDVYWDHTPDWGYATAAVEGSSFLKLPVILQWFTGNIGFHHVHHLSSRIPNYNLARCHYENEFFRRIKPLTFRASFKTLNLRLWDETARRMISFRKLSLMRS
jgi:acyl-lipid omega-6 desaturase (Delta-12 desaturase)